MTTNRWIDSNGLFLPWVFFSVYKHISENNIDNQKQLVDSSRYLSDRRKSRINILRNRTKTHRKISPFRIQNKTPLIFIRSSCKFSILTNASYSRYLISKKTLVIHPNISNLELYLQNIS